MRSMVEGAARSTRVPPPSPPDQVRGRHLPRFAREEPDGASSCTSGSSKTGAVLYFSAFPVADRSSRMLLGLTIRDVVLIDRLSLAFRPGLCVLTGETGAGKSILLDALGLALGRRADASLVRPGAEQAMVAA